MDQKIEKFLPEFAKCNYKIAYKFKKLSLLKKILNLFLKFIVNILRFSFIIFKNLIYSFGIKFSF